MSTSPTDTPSRHSAKEGATAAAAPGVRDALAAARTQHGESLLELSERGPLLLVFLRHFG
jgi:hypothetical protein